MATPYGLRVSPGVSERRKSRYPLGLREKHIETERSGGSYAFSRAVVLTFPAGPTAFAYNGDRPPGDLSLWLPMVDGEDRRRDPMASGLSVGSSAAIDFTAGKLTLLRALIAGPPTLNRHPLSGESCRGIGWFIPTVTERT